MGVEYGVVLPLIPMHGEILEEPRVEPIDKGFRYVHAYQPRSRAELEEPGVPSAYVEVQEKPRLVADEFGNVKPSFEPPYTMSVSARADQKPVYEKNIPLTNEYGQSLLLAGLRLKFAQRRAAKRVRVIAQHLR